VTLRYTNTPQPTPVQSLVGLDLRWIFTPNATSKYQRRGSENPGAAQFCRRWWLAFAVAVPHSTRTRAAGIPERDEAFRRAAMLIPDASRWKPALVAIADHRAADAAEIYHDIGRGPLEAAAHVLAARSATAEGRHADSSHPPGARSTSSKGSRQPVRRSSYGLLGRATR
jgi:hypothetical protein